MRAKFSSGVIVLAVVRLIILALFFVFSTLLGIVICIFSPFNANHVHRFASWYGMMAKILGVRVKVENEPKPDCGARVYIANHQNSYDIFTLTSTVPERTVSIGKKDLIWVPFFGQLYWLSGNILIDRKNTAKAKGTIAQTVKKIKDKQISVWLFPEGTRSYGRGLLPFKSGAFHTAIQAEVPLVPVCMNTTHQQIKLNRWNNGTVYIKFLPEQNLDPNRSVKEQVNEIHQQMNDTIKQLDQAAQK